MRKLRMLAACEMSGRVATAFARRGWEAVSCDLMASELPDRVFTGFSVALDRKVDGSYRHVQGDVRELFGSHHPVNYDRTQEWCKAYADSWSLWDLVIAFPPCTHLSSAGARYWKAKQADGRQQAAAEFFLEMVNAPAPYVAVENPAGIMGRQHDPLYRRPDQVVQPWWFGDALAKKTCLWLKNLPLLTADRMVDPEGRVATGGGSWRTDMKAGRSSPQAHEDSEGRAMRDIVRSRTLPNTARAMADQWGRYIEETAA